MKIRFITLATFALFAAGVVAAQTNDATSSSQTSSSSAEQKEIQSLKNKLETKVLELKKKDQKGIAGRITGIEKSKLVIKIEDDGSYEIKLDDVLTKVYELNNGKKTEVKVSTLAKNDYIVVSGPEANKSVQANEIYVDSQLFATSGKVTEVNKEDFYIRILGFDKETYTIDVEDSTKKQLLNSKTLELEAIGFTKIKEGDTVHFVYEKTGKEREKNRHSAQKLLIIPQEYFQK
ncbi:MAG: hypothetical protein AAB966_01205 [Patescibacteria group bacterium]